MKKTEVSLASGSTVSAEVVDNGGQTAASTSGNAREGGSRAEGGERVAASTSGNARGSESRADNAAGGAETATSTSGTARGSESRADNAAGGAETAASTSGTAREGGSRAENAAGGAEPAASASGTARASGSSAENAASASGTARASGSSAENAASASGTARASGSTAENAASGSTTETAASTSGTASDSKAENAGGVENGAQPVASTSDSKYKVRVKKGKRSITIFLKGLASHMQYPEIEIVGDIDDEDVSILSADEYEEDSDEDVAVPVVDGEKVDEAVKEDEPPIDAATLKIMKQERRLARIFEELKHHYQLSENCLFRFGHPMCVLCSVHAPSTVEKKQESPDDPLGFVGKLTMPSNIDKHRSTKNRIRGPSRPSDVFGSPDLVYKTGLLFGGGGGASGSSPPSAPLAPPPLRSTSPQPSTSRSPQRSTSRSPQPSTSRSPQPSTSSSPPQASPTSPTSPTPPDSGPPTFGTRIIRLFRCCCSMGMKLRCIEGNDGGNSYFLLQNIGDKDSATEKQEELRFFDDTGHCVDVVVEKNLRALDLTRLLAVKNQVVRDYCWVLVEHWPDLGLERALEDHEDVLSIHRRTEVGAKKFIFRRFANKYDFFTKPEEYFPPDMIDLRPPRPGYMHPEKHPEQLERVLTTAQEFPAIFSQVNLRQRTNRNVWVKTFLLLTGSKILMSSKVQVVAKFLRSWRETSSGYRELQGDDAIDQDDGLEQYVAEGEGNEEELEVLADLKDYEVYTSLNAKNQLKGPTEFGVVLRKTSEEDFTDSVVLSFDKGKDRVCWVTAMRLAKYGKQIRENYRAFKNKQEPLPPSGSAANLSVNENHLSRVAMDFTGKVGRIVEDPREAKEIADYEGASWKQKIRARPSAITGVLLEYGEDDKSHNGQPWYHKTLSRDQATALLTNFAKHDGIFIVRGSRSNPGGNVLSIRSKDRVIHVPILMIEDSVDKIMCYTIDGGLTRFYDICQLIEFYRLNAGSLPTRLTNHIIQKQPADNATPQ